MKKTLMLGMAGLAVMLSSCSTPPAPRTFHATDHNALVIDALDNQNSQILQPEASPQHKNSEVLTQAGSTDRHQMVVVILENYTEREVGDEFRSRGLPWFMGLRGLGFDHIVFLQGNGATSPEGLVTLAEYY